MSEPTPRDVAQREFQAWLDAPKRSSVAQRVHGERAAIARVLNIRLDGVLAHDRPASANRRWLCETIRAWAPLEVIFPTCDYTGVAGVSGELPRHRALLVERAYGHVLAATRNIGAACDLLRADAQLLELQVTVATALQPLLQAAATRDATTAASAAATDPAATHPNLENGLAATPAASATPAAPASRFANLEWPDELRRMSLGMAEFLQRSLDDECRRARVAA